ncbi:MAG: hypothetical protein JOZ72_14975 [Alphaproteobacteria bacterium]|nr:hypothetical protein [Alphaproteobacteria bacterium]
MEDDAHNSDMPAQVALGQDSPHAKAYLEEHTRLTRLQIAQHEEENATRRRLLKLEHASAIFKLALEVAAGLVATVVVIALAAMMWNAANDQGLVVESFSVPPDLAGRGLTGEVMAARLLDRLSAMQQQTQSSRAPSSYENNWGNDIKLQIPDTGVSIGEFNRSLHAWLGHQTRITGEVYRTTSGLAVTARVGHDTSPTYKGSDADLDQLVQQAAESVYRATQPYRYAVYLNNAGRIEESEVVYNQLVAGGSSQDRAWALVGLENLYVARGDDARGLEMLKQALGIRPNFLMAWFNIANTESQLQHDEAALAAQRKVVALLRGRKDEDIVPDSNVLDLDANEAALAGEVGDLRRQIAFYARAEGKPDFNGQLEQARQNTAFAYAQLHDRKAADDVFSRLPPPSNQQTALSRRGNRDFGQLLLGHPETLLKDMPQFDVALRNFDGPRRRQFWPVAALAHAMAGDFRTAHALIDKTPADCTLCLRARGRIDMLEKNWAGADAWFARAARDAPSSPLVWTDWGQMLLAKGDAAGAIAKFETAHEKGPHFADPLEGWGEALMMRNRSDLALAKFEAAAHEAPNWKRLHAKWSEALGYLGRKDEAAKQRALARSLDG